MSIRRLFVIVIVAFALLTSVSGGYLAWREASEAVESELDMRAEWVAVAAAETGLQAAIVGALQPGFEDSEAWISTQAKLGRLRNIVPESYIIDQNNSILVSSFPADSIPIGTRAHFLELFQDELQEARTVGRATTPAFQGNDDVLYKWGFAELEQSDILLAVLMPADFLSPVANLRRNLLATTVFAAVLATVLAVLLAGGVTEPLDRLSRVALRIQRGRMVDPVALERGLELSRLSRAMERMRQGILERDEQLRLMLAQVAHEIRNPLGGLELFASAAAETSDPDERAALLQRVRSEVSALNAIIDDFLTFASPVRRPGEVCDLREPLGEAAQLVRAELEEGGGSLTVSLPAAPLIATVSPDHAKRAALNLLRNAAQAAPNVELRGWVERGETVVSVTDDGPGVPAELRDRIFDPFVTDKEQGAGLGLAIVRKLVEVHGGRVQLMNSEDTDVGSGSEFRIYFRGLEDPPPATRVTS